MKPLPASPVSRLLPLLAAVFLGGCMSYPVHVSARREAVPPPAARTYWLDLADVRIAANGDRHIGPALTCLRTAMAHRGYTEVFEQDAAAVVVEFGYGVTKARVDTSFTPRRNDTSPREVVSLDTGKVVSKIPRSDVGVITSVEPRYTVWVRIIAHDAKSKKELWSVDTHAEIGAADHNNILPVMIAAAEPLLEPSGPVVLLASVGQESPEVKALRAGR